MRKFCIFCGKEPDNKNKEHIIPQWLIKMTGDPKRIASYGKKNGKEIKFPWLNYVFPSCEKCNTDFGKVEEKVKVIFEKLISEKSITHNEFNLFLDWLDKIRVGIWLGQSMLKNKDFEPNFFINDRVGSKDRLCLVYKLNDSEKGIGYIGTETPAFEYVPSCFTLVINNFVFLNYSKEFLLAKNLGFPYPSSYSYIPEGGLIAEKIIEGKSEITYPIIDGKIIKPVIKFYQSILSGVHKYQKPFAGRGRKYFANNCYIFNKRLIQSKIFVSDEFSEYSGFWRKKENFKFNEDFERVVLMEFIVQMTLEHQNHSIKEALNNIELLDKKELKKCFFDSLIAYNTGMIKEIDSYMKDFVINI